MRASYMISSVLLHCCINSGVDSFTFGRHCITFPKTIPSHVVRAKHIRTQITLSGTTDAEGNGIELVSLDGLGVDHEAIGESMAKSVAAWLDEEVSTLFLE